MNFSIGCDHAGPAYKNTIIEYLKERGFSVKNCGTDSTESVDYPDHIHPVAKQVSQKETSIGIIICGSGNGANMTANKHEKIRSALCWNNEIARLSRTHNNANVLSIPSRFISLEEALEIVKTFINTEFEGGRHLTRINKIQKK